MSRRKIKAQRCCTVCNEPRDAISMTTVPKARIKQTGEKVRICDLCRDKIMAMKEEQNG